MSINCQGNETKTHRLAPPSHDRRPPGLGSLRGLSREAGLRGVPQALRGGSRFRSSPGRQPSLLQCATTAEQASSPFCARSGMNSRIRDPFTVH